MIKRHITLLFFSFLHISLFAKDTTVVHLYNHAHAPSQAFAQDSIEKYDFYQSNYVSLGDIISQHVPTLHFQLGDPLVYSGVSMFNSQPMTNIIALNGVPFQDMFSGQGDLNTIQPEAIHKISIYTGLEASILGGTSGQYIYLQENMYSYPKPFSRLWYIQGGYDLIGTEGVFTQNIDSSTNIHAGYRRVSSSGMLRNSGADIWNTRIGIRHQLSTHIHSSLQWLFSNQGAYHNGGIKGQYDSPLNTSTYFDNYFDRSYTNTIQSSITFDKLINDHSSLFVNAYIGHSELETRGINPFIVQDSATILFEPFYRGGFNGRLELSNIIPDLSIMSELGIQYDDYSFLKRLRGSSTRIYGYVYASYAIGTSDVLRFGLRGNNQTNDQINYGFNYSSTFSDAFQIHFDYSRTNTILPVQYELVSNGNNENTDLAFLKLTYKKQYYELNIQPFLRNIHQPNILQVSYDSSTVNQLTSIISVLPSTDHNSMGLIIDGQCSIDDVTIHSMITYTRQQDLVNIAPILFARINAQYHINIGASTISIGGTLRLSDGATTMRYIPYLNIFAHDGNNISDAFQWNGLDVYTTAILGNARIRASIMNVFSQQFMDVSGYPIQDNVIRLSLNWSFFD